MGYLSLQPIADTGLARAVEPSDLVPAWARAPAEPQFTDMRTVDVFARVLAAADGGVTTILETWAREPVVIGEVVQREGRLEESLEILRTDGGASVLRRDVVLIGSRSRRALLYAESLIMLDRLPTYTVAELLTGSTPIRRLLRESRLETHREILSIGTEPAATLASRFALRPSELLVSRTYRIFANSTPLIAVTERFPTVMIWDSPAWAF